MLVFEKRYEVTDYHYAEIEIEDYELDGLTEEEAREYIDKLLWDRAYATADCEIEDTIDDTFTQIDGEPWQEVLARLAKEEQE